MHFNGAFVPNWLLIRDGKDEISPGAKLCYARLCQYAGKKGICNPKQEGIANELGVTARQVQDYLKELESLGLIISARDGYRGQKSYRFLYHKWISDTNKCSCVKTNRSSGLNTNDSSCVYIKDSLKELNTKEPAQDYIKRVNDFFNALEPEWLGEVKKAFPQVNLPAELNKMKAWLISNPDKPKKNIKRFAVNWLSRNKSDFPGESREVTKPQPLGAAGRVING